MHRRHIGPVVPLDNVQHGPGLQGVRGHDPQEVLEQSLIAQVDAGGRVGDLRDVEELQQVLHLNGNRAGSRSDHSSDGLLGGWRLVGWGTVNAPFGPVLIISDGDEGVPDELDALLQGYGGVPAGVPDLTAQADVWEQVRVGVDPVQSVEHGLNPLDAILLADVPAFPLGHFLRRRLVVDGEERADDHVSVHSGHGAGHGAGDHRPLIDAAAVGEHEDTEEKRGETQESEETHLYACHIVPHRVNRANCAGILSAVCQYIHVYPSDHDLRARHPEHIHAHLQKNKTHYCDM